MNVKMKEICCSKNKAKRYFKALLAKGNVNLPLLRRQLLGIYTFLGINTL